MFNFSQEFILRNVRIALFWAAGALTSKGVIDASMAETLAGFVMQGVTWGWSLYGNRLIAKVNEIVKIPNFVILAPSDVANATTSPDVVPIDTVKLVAPKPMADAVARSNPDVVVSSK